MNKDLSISIYLLTIILVLFVHCSDPVSTPPDIPIETLLSAPDTLNIENQKLVLSTSLWRDFQPFSPPNGKPLIALVFIETVDSSDISSSINSDAIYMVNNNQVWKSFFKEEDLPDDQEKTYRLTHIAREGPKWGPDIYVGVVVRIEFKNEYYLLKASYQYIERTD